MSELTAAAVTLALLTALVIRRCQEYLVRARARHEAYRRYLSRSFMDREVAAMTPEELYDAPAMREAFGIVVDEAMRLPWP